MNNLSLIIFSLCLIVSVHAQEDPYKPIVDEMPLPIGGYESIYKKIEYPTVAKKAGVEGRVYLLAYINEKGGVDDIKVVKGIGAGCDEAASDAVRGTKFSPGKVGGQVTKVKLTIPIIFKITK